MRIELARKPMVWLLLAGIGVFLSGCSTWIGLAQPIQSSMMPLDSTSSLGQTFSARYSGLEGISLYMKPEKAGQGNLELTLYNSPTKESELAHSSIPVNNIQTAGWYRFGFPLINNSKTKDYYIDLKSDSSGKILVATGPGDVYLDGSLYQNGQPVDGQATFRLAYNPQVAAIGLASEGLTWLKWLLIGIGLYILPGWGILSVLFPSWAERTWSEKAGLAGGLSLAVYPLLFLWTSLVGLNLGRLYAWLPPLVGVGLIIFKYIRNPRHATRSYQSRAKIVQILPDLAVLLLIGLTIISRLWVIRGLDAPMWGDSLQHTMIAQLIIDHNGLFNSWQPYAALTSFTYHFGFHTLIAVFSWVTQLPVTTATLVTGQLVNILAIIVLVPLANRLGRSQWAGVAAVLIAGLLSPMPMAYTNWGRYTQLAGQVILPVVIYFGWIFLDKKAFNWKLAIIVWVLMGGLALTHYRVLIFAILFFPAYFIFQVRSRGIPRLIWRTFLAGIGGALLFLPWFMHAFSGGIIYMFARQLSIPASDVPQFMSQANAIGGLSPFLPNLLWILLVIVIAWGLWRREIDFITALVWWLLILLAANPAWINLPGTGAIGSFTVLIAAYIPAGLLLGAGAGWLTHVSDEQIKITGGLKLGLDTLLLIIIIGLGIWGGRQRLTEIQPKGYALFTKPDERASAWIDQNLPSDAKFLVNAFFAYGNSVIVGADGGWWLPLTAHRQITVPPLNYATEKGEVSNYRQVINSLQANIEVKGVTNPEVISELRQRGINYVYIGQRQGSVNNSGQRLDTAQLLGNPSFKLLYQQDRVWIFERLP